MGKRCDRSLPLSAHGYIRYRLVRVCGNIRYRP